MGPGGLFPPRRLHSAALEEPSGSAQRRTQTEKERVEWLSNGSGGERDCLQGVMLIVHTA